MYQEYLKKKGVVKQKEQEQKDHEGGKMWL